MSVLCQSSTLVDPVYRLYYSSTPSASLDPTVSLRDRTHLLFYRHGNNKLPVSESQNLLLFSGPLPTIAINVLGHLHESRCLDM